MGAVRLVYDETLNEFKRLGWFGELDIEGTRKVMQSRLRYCLQGSVLYLPADNSLVESGHRLCWGRIRSEEFDNYNWMLDPITQDVNFDRPLEANPLDYHMPFTGIGFGVAYSKRHREMHDGRVPVKEFISQAIIDSIAENPEVLQDITKSQFEELMAEISARMGFHVDLYRSSKDDGIDFLRVDAEKTDPVILCVQCKHPDKPVEGKKRRTLSVATVRKIYGVSKAYDLQGCIAVTSSTYTPDAKKFADLKPHEIQLVDANNVIEWVKQYRWNTDE